MRRPGHTLNLQSFLPLGLIIFSVCNAIQRPALAQTAPLPDAEESHPGIGMESRYAEAVIELGSATCDEVARQIGVAAEEGDLLLNALARRRLMMKLEDQWVAVGAPG